MVLPKRWVVERTLAWLGRCRRLAKDWECLNNKARAFLLMACIRCRACPPPCFAANVCTISHVQKSQPRDLSPMD